MIRPPAFAQWLLAILVEGRCKEDLLGDLHEEFERLSLETGKPARSWYWSQTIRSVPGLFLRRIELAGYYRSFSVISGYLVGVFVLLGWDMLVSRPAILAILESGPQLQPEYLRFLYFALTAVGGLLSGAIAATISFSDERSALANVLISLTPVFVIELAVGLSRLALADQLTQVPYIALRSAVLAMTIVLGGTIVLRRGRRT